MGSLLDGTPVVSKQITGVSFSLYTSDEVRKLSVKRVTNPVLLDALNHPTIGGLYDPALGPQKTGEICQTCSLNYSHCPGHAGHIELALPVYHPIFVNSMFQLLRGTCLYCYHLKASRVQVAVLQAQIKLVEAGHLDAAGSLPEYLTQISHDIEKERPKVGKNEPAGEETMDVVDEQVKSIEGYVAAAMASAKPTHTRTMHMVAMRRQIVNAFLKALPGMKQCRNCKGYAPALRKDGASKMFLLPLPEKQRRTMEAKGMHIKTSQGAATEQITMEPKVPKSGPKSESDTDSDEEENDGSSEDEESEDEQDSRRAASTPGRPAAGHHKKPLYITPLEVRGHLSEMWAREKRTMIVLYGSQSSLPGKRRVPSPDIFFLECVPVPPSRFRPASVMGDQTFESPQNTYLGNILKHNLTLLELRNPPPTKDKLGEGVVKKPANDVADLVRIQQTWIQMQNEVNFLMDSSLAGKNADKMPSGIRQMMEKKEGLFRMHMMGKRVNFACRSVISPDPYIGTHEIGIPMVFATKLTYPEPVTPYNINELRQCVMNGPDVHPGATHVVGEVGNSISLHGMTADQRKALASQLLTPPEGGKTAASLNKKVLRHIRTGDVVLANRQPTLHKPSMMAHCVRVLPGEKTLRMHYANCNTYNADFDGDEMNVHFPQSELARAEAYNIANTNNQYLVPTSGKPLRGLIQDHVASGTVLTSRNTMLDRERYQYLIYMALPHHKTRIHLLPPAILKPRPLWTGKQVVSTLLRNICMGDGKKDSEALYLDGTSKVPASEWGPNSEEATVIFRRGELLCGVLDKNQFGATAYGLVHACQELYGADVAGDLLTALGRLFTAFLQFRGLTCGIEDLVLTSAADQERLELLTEARRAGQEEVAKFVGVANNKDVNAVQAGLAEVYKSNDKMAGLDAAMKTRLNQLTSNVISACLPSGARKPFPENCLALMIQSGAKGSSVNSSQISCLLGQQELEGRRVPIMATGRSLPSFLPFDTSARSGGYVMGRFLTGIKPQEYFFHCMAGREGLVDTAVKTANSGYLQRCLIKHLESLRVQYDLTVRDVDNSVVQFNYGEDSLDVTKTAFLKQFGFMLENEPALLRKYRPEEALRVLETGKAPKHFSKIAKALKKQLEKPDPAIAVLRPDKYLGSVSERFYAELNAYMDKHADLKHDKAKRAAFLTVMSLKYREALAHPGEAVGLLAAQSVGEPSTQMTLNTFHFAGFGAMNVTLGIPRLREILMTASEQIKTPAMTLPLMDMSNAQAEAVKMKHRLSRLTMTDIVKDISVQEWLARPETAAGERFRMYRIRIEFDTEVMASPEIQLRVEELFKGLQTGFARNLQLEINKHLKRTTGAKVVLGLRGKKAGKGGKDEEDEEGVEQAEEDGYNEGAGKKKGKEDTESASEEEMEVDSDVDAEGGDNDAATAKELKNKTAAVSYDDDEISGGSGSDESSSSSEDEDDDDEEGEGKEEDEEAQRAAEAKSAARMSDIKDAHISAMLMVSPRFAEYDVSETGEWMELTVRLPSHTRKLLLLSAVEQLMDKVVIRSSPGIRRCMVGDPPKGSTVPVLQTEGVNIREMWKYGSVLDVNRIYSNDIVAILKTYGVEAARAAIMREVSGVFKVYGIAVDMRHLSLIADYMTFEGGYKPFNRIGIESNTSPFAKMSFETTMNFMRTAVLSGDFDPLQSPSSRLVVGRVVEGGTGCVDLLHPLAE